MRHAIDACKTTRWGREPRHKTLKAYRREWPFGKHHELSSRRFTFADECCAFGKNFDIPLSTAFKTAMNEFPSITMDADVVGGVPRIAGTRIPVYMILDAVEHYGTTEGVLKSYSTLDPSQVRDALSFASKVLEQPIDNESEASLG